MRRVLSLLAAPFRRRRWIWWLLALLVLPWAWIELFDDPPGRVDLPDLPGTRPWPVWVVRRSHHTSIFVEQPSGFGLGQPKAPDAPYVEYAWGDRRFYMESNFWPHALFAAALLPSSSVCYVRSWSQSPAVLASSAEVYHRDLTLGEMRALLLTLEQAFDRTEYGERPEAFEPVDGYRGRFYPGRASYIFWSSCNAWTLNRLRDANLDISALGVILASQVPDRLPGFKPVK
ncbi:MAG: hypothetical protein CMJ83_16800 [Planctomycetes bacterium]|nr:hypothetical protein [Planctomycetota bacterium]